MVTGKRSACTRELKLLLGTGKSMVVVEVRKFMNSFGAVPAKEVIDRLQTREGAALFLIEVPQGGYQLTPYDPALEKKMTKADKIMKRYRNILHVLR
jgi:hypothetical protein